MNRVDTTWPARRGRVQLLGLPETISHTVLGKIIPGGVPVSEMKVRSLVKLNCPTHSAFHWWSAQCAALLLLLADELMSCCAEGTNGCLDLRRRALTPGGQVWAEWSREPGPMVRRAGESLAE